MILYNYAIEHFLHEFSYKISKKKTLFTHFIT